MIGLIAVRGEATPLLKFISVEATIEQIQTRFHQGNLAGRPVVLAEVGPGKVQTAAVTQHLIDRYGAGLMMSCGSAGALSPQLQLNDVVLAEKVTVHDAGMHLNNGFQYLGIYDNSRPDGFHYHRSLSANPTLLRIAQQAATAITWPKTRPQIKIGGLISGDQVIAAKNKKDWLRDTFNALVVDMESGAMAQVAFLNNIPWLAIRAVSDRADSTIDFDLPSLITYSDEPDNMLARVQQTRRKVTAIAKKPTHLRTMLKIRQRIRQAAANAAQVTAAIITQLE